MHLGKITFALGSLYHGSKFAVEGISEAMSYELAEVGIRIKLIEPGAVSTNFAQAIDFYYDNNLQEYSKLVKALQIYAQNTRSRGITAMAVAKKIYEAATDKSSQMRYPVGSDSEKIISLRKTMEDKDFFKFMRKRLGI